MPILELNGIHKRFPGVHALKGVHFALKRGEIHALVGENGAGKSTLMKVITGIVQKDSGEITYLGRPFNARNPRQALRAGIGIIHQELHLMDRLTVAENVFIGRETTRAGGVLLDIGRQKQRTVELLRQLKLDLDPTAIVGKLTVGRRQMVEIAKAVSHSLNVLVLDEPTAALSEHEIVELFGIMRDLAARGVAMVYISHRMDEIGQIADRVTVMRDGEYVATRDTNGVSKEEIITMMVGRTIYEQPKRYSRVAPDAPVVLRVRDLNAGRSVREVSFDLHRGEILGFAGLMGAGRTETARAIFGADPIDRGTIEVHGARVRIDSPCDAVARGIGYLSEDRKRFGLALGRSVLDNAVITACERFARGPFVDDRAARAEVNAYIRRLAIRTPSVEQLLRNLSGGNQQKVVIAKWLIRNSDILIFDEPTRGIDVGAKSEIYQLMNDLVADGKSIIMISSELPEILRMSDRVVVMSEGRIAGTLDISRATQATIMNLATTRYQERVAV